jgi:hypothetical protein
MKYSIFIDETGRFGYGDSKSLVGGVVFKDKWKPNKISRILHPVLARYNKEKATDITIEQLHAAYLSKDGHRELVYKVIEELQQHCQSIFVCGDQHMEYLGPQAEYYLKLRAALCGILGDLEICDKDKVQVNIANRALTAVLDGYVPSGAQKHIDKAYADNLAFELSQRFQLKPGNIEVTLTKFADMPALISADFVLYGLKDQPELFKPELLHNYSWKVLGEGEPAKTRFNANLGRFGREQALKDLIFTAVDSSQTRAPEYIKLLREKLAQGYDSELLVKKITEEISQVFATKAEIARNVTRLKSLSRILGDISADMQMRNLQLRLKMQLHTHGYIRSGREEYQKFAETHSEELHNNPFARYLEYLDSELYVVQNKRFSNLDFDGVEKDMREVLNRYQSIKKLIVSQQPTKYDDIEARLLGTLGQALAFSADMPGQSEKRKQELYAAAEDLLCQDLKYLPEKGYRHAHGKNFLTSLYWRKGDLDKATKQLIGPTATIKDLGTKIFQNQYQILNHLRLIAACLQKQLLSAQTAMKVLRGYQDRDPDTTETPENQIVKWSCFIRYLAGTTEEVSEIPALTEAYIQKQRNLPLLELIRANEILLYARMTGLTEECGLAKEILLDLSRQHKQLFAQAKDLPWVKHLLAGTPESVEPEEIILGLPYYYA